MVDYNKLISAALLVAGTTLVWAWGYNAVSDLDRAPNLSLFAPSTDFRVGHDVMTPLAGSPPAPEFSRASPRQVDSGQFGTQILPLPIPTDIDNVRVGGTHAQPDRIAPGLHASLREVKVHGHEQGVEKPPHFEGLGPGWSSGK